MVPSPPGRTGAVIDRDGLTEAWGDGILGSLPARVKALYSGGRFVAVDQEGAQFALPSAPHRDRCAELAPQVEAALAAHFGSPVHLVLVVDGADPPAPVAPGGSRNSTDARAEPGLEPDEVDPDEFRAATVETDQASAAEARLLEAFPGASEVAE